jgi:hypothetical protein
MRRPVSVKLALERLSDCLGTGKPNWLTVRPSETAPCWDPVRLEESILLVDRSRAWCPIEPRLLRAPAVVVRCPPNVYPAKRSRVRQNAIDQVNAGAESGDVAGSFLPSRASFNCGGLARGCPKVRDANIFMLGLAAGEHECSTMLTEAGTMTQLCDHVHAIVGPRAVEVSVRWLDDLIFLDGYAVSSLLFVDVEGGAGGVQRGAQRLLSQRHPLVFCEVNSAQENQDIDCILAHHGYAPKAQVGRGKKLPLHFLARPAAP